ncbi:hypothetical protein ZOSMA_22G00810 [Zostera marina]|uniref:Protein ARV n=1 Tax=Zostera marina TaxID=29655 RepID=A0A0K9PIK4_ZOSMR|nr:hypothetical protein ZOSMA_22G00810 [Zostera marina]
MSETELRCVHCGCKVGRLVVQYSPGNIRLIKCEKCKLVADPYIECEFMIVFIDLILHKEKAYRHLLYNMLNWDLVSEEGLLWKSTIIYIVLDGCRYLFLSEFKEELRASRNLLFPIWICTKVCLSVVLGNVMFLATLFLLISLSQTVRLRRVFQAILFSSYLKIFLVAMMVWEFPTTVIFIIDIFVLSSNAVALKVLMQLPIANCTLVCIGAHVAKFITCTVFTNLNYAWL